MKKRFDYLNLSSIIVTVLAHIFVLITSIKLLRYSRLSEGIILGLIAIFVCLLIICDICLAFATGYKDKKITIATIVLSTIMLVVGIGGTFTISKVSTTVDNIIENTDGEQYETINGVIAVYKNTAIKSIEDLNGKTVGSLGTFEASAATVGMDELKENNISATYKEYNMTSDLFEALVDGEVDAAIFSDVYRLQLTASDEEGGSGFETYLENTEDIYKFSKKVKTAYSENSKKDLTSEAFTILLLGYAPNQGGGGLTDSIILASVNPKTLTATLTSIPRDSYVPISCYKNQRSKINEAGAASKACIMQTVSNLMDVDVDFYAEINFKGLVEIVDALDGIYIDSPIEFTGQSSDTDRGDYNVWVPAGPYVANGEQALAFARERHHMPNGDFDRQIHQQEVISEIINKVLKLRDVNKALKVMDAAGDNLSTNMSLDQLISLFNYVISANDVGGIDKFSMLNIQSTRLIGYTRWYYSYSMRLPLYGYYLYDGSIKENAKLSDDTLGDFDKIEQDYDFKFFVYYPYSNDNLYHTEFNEARIPEDIPPFYPYLTTKTYDEVVVWCNENGVTLNVRALQPGDTGYNANAVGKIVEQWPLYGELVSDYPTCTITIIGQPLTEQEKVPNFVGKKSYEAKDWAAANGYQITVEKIAAEGVSKGGTIAEQSVPAGTAISKQKAITIKVYEYSTVDLSTLKKGTTTKAEIETWCKNNVSSDGACKFTTKSDSKYKEGVLIDFTNTSTKSNGTFTFTVAGKVTSCEVGFFIKDGVCTEHKEHTFKPVEGTDNHKCDICNKVEAHKDAGSGKCVCGKEMSTEHTHDYSVFVEKISPNGETAGYDVYKCDKCDKTTKKNYICSEGYQLNSNGDACEVKQTTPPVEDPPVENPPTENPPVETPSNQPETPVDPVDQPEDSPTGTQTD